MLKKSLIALVVTVTLVCGPVMSANASTINSGQAQANLTEEQQQVIDDYMNNKEVTQNNKMRALYRASFKRGSFLMCSRDNIDFYASGGKVTSSELWQEKGYVFPNTVRVNGGTRYYASSTLHKWRATKTMGAGVLTEWGDLTVYNNDVTDYYGVDGSGNGYWY